MTVVDPTQRPRAVLWKVALLFGAAFALLAVLRACTEDPASRRPIREAGGSLPDRGRHET
jgi:hypothetical protein